MAHVHNKGKLRVHDGTGRSTPMIKTGHGAPAAPSQRKDLKTGTITLKKTADPASAPRPLGSFYGDNVQSMVRGRFVQPTDAATARIPNMGAPPSSSRSR